MVIIAGDGDMEMELIKLGFEFHAVNLSRKGVNLLAEIKFILKLNRLIKLIKPDIIHSFTIKPIIYTGVVNLFSNMKCLNVASITGLGSASLSKRLKHKGLWFFLTKLYKLVFLKKNTVVIFENTDDLKLFSDLKIVNANSAHLVNGAGIDTTEFIPSLDKVEPYKVTMVSRLLKDKGVLEFIEAGRILREKGTNVVMQLVGSTDFGNISSITKEELDSAVKRGDVEYLGQRDDIKFIYQKSHVACLPSYREGLPKSLIEAAACGLPIITTDVPGCRQMVFNSKNGWLVPAKNAMKLAEAIELILNSPGKLDEMGKQSRIAAVMLFDYEVVISSFHEIYGLENNFELKV